MTFYYYVCEQVLGPVGLREIGTLRDRDDLGEAMQVCENEGSGWISLAEALARYPEEAGMPTDGGQKTALAVNETVAADTADRLFFEALPHHEWLLPSLINTQPCC